MAKKNNKLDAKGIALFGDAFYGWADSRKIGLRMADFKEYVVEILINTPPSEKGITSEELIKGFNDKEIEAGREPFHVKPTLNTVLSVIDAAYALAFKRKFNAVEQQMSPVHPADEIVPKQERIEGKAETLAEALLDDAAEVLKDPDELKLTPKGEEYYDTTSRRKYVLGVLSAIVKKVQGEKSLKIKMNEDTRSNTNFLMDLLKKAQSGEMSLEELHKMAPTKVPEPERDIIDQDEQIPASI